VQVFVIANGGVTGNRSAARSVSYPASSMERKTGKSSRVAGLM
jgi:hypothetical protein